MEQNLFYIFGAVAVLASLGLISSKNPVHAALFMLVVFFDMAALFIMLNAEFLAAAQILVYAGAIMVLFLFVIMLLRLQPEELKNTSRHSFQKIFGIVFVLVLVAELALVVLNGTLKGRPGAYSPSTIAELGGNTEAIAKVMFTDYLFPFELTSIILFMAMVGAVVMTKKEM